MGLLEIDEKHENDIELLKEHRRKKKMAAMLFKPLTNSRCFNRKNNRLKRLSFVLVKQNLYAI